MGPVTTIEPPSQESDLAAGREKAVHAIAIPAIMHSKRCHPRTRIIKRALSNVLSTNNTLVRYKR
jgi:hypothetical protein